MNVDEPMLGGGAPPTENAPAGADETRCADASNARPIPSHASDGTASHIERSQSLA